MHEAMEKVGADGEERGRGLHKAGLAGDNQLSRPALSVMSVYELAVQCRQEISNYGREDPYSDASSVELLRRATVDGNQEARTCLQQCLSGLVRDCLRCHPRGEAACLLDSEEHYVFQTFERFWQTTAHIQKSEFSSFAAALRYLRASLNGTILDTLRVSSRPREVPFAEMTKPGEPHEEKVISSVEVWEALSSLLPDAREQRLAYLLFNCGLSPKEIVHRCPQEFVDVGEIYRLWHTITERVLSNVD